MIELNLEVENRGLKGYATGYVREVQERKDSRGAIREKVVNSRTSMLIAVHSRSPGNDPQTPPHYSRNLCIIVRATAIVQALPHSPQDVGDIVCISQYWRVERRRRCIWSALEHKLPIVDSLLASTTSFLRADIS